MIYHPNSKLIDDKEKEKKKHKKWKIERKKEDNQTKKRVVNRERNI